MRFEKVSFEEYVKQYDEAFGDELEDIKKEYDAIKLPRRATTGSAGHDFFAPFPFKLSTDPTTGFPKEIKFGTGIKVVLDSDKVLMCYPRSGQGFKYKLQLYNTVGIIDSDYINSKNEGHIFVKLVLDTDELVTLTVNEGEGFMQGIVTQFFALDEEEVIKERDGGFGSTTTNTAVDKSNTEFAKGGYVDSSVGVKPTSRHNPLLDLVKDVKPYNTGCVYNTIGKSTTNYCASPSFTTEGKGNWLSSSEAIRNIIAESASRNKRTFDVVDVADLAKQMKHLRELGFKYSEQNDESFR